jgi:hypothetical protein
MNVYVYAFRWDCRRSKVDFYERQLEQTVLATSVRTDLQSHVLSISDEQELILVSCGLRAARKMLLSAMLHAPMTFVNTTPSIGRIAN